MRVTRASFCSQDRCGKVPKDAVVANHGVQVCLRRLIRQAMGYELLQALTGRRVFREAVEPARAGTRDGPQRSLGWILEAVVCNNVLYDLLFLGDALIKHEARDGAHLGHKPLLTRDASAVLDWRTH